MLRAHPIILSPPCETILRSQHPNTLPLNTSASIQQPILQATYRRHTLACSELVAQRVLGGKAMARQGDQRAAVLDGDHHVALVCLQGFGFGLGLRSGLGLGLELPCGARPLAKVGVGLGSG